MELNLIAWWRAASSVFGGATIVDTVGTSNGTLTDTGTWTAAGGGVGQHLVLDGDTDEIDVTESGTPSFDLQSHSWAAHVKLNDTPGSATEVIWSRCENIFFGGIEWGLRESGGKGVMSYAYNDGSVRGWYSDSTLLELDTWYYLSASWDQPGGVVHFYVNGQPKDDVATTTGTVAYLISSIIIGNQNQNDNWPGGWSELLLAARVWTDAEHLALYQDFQSGYLGLARPTVTGGGSQEMSLADQRREAARWQSRWSRPR